MFNMYVFEERMKLQSTNKHTLTVTHKQIPNTSWELCMCCILSRSYANSPLCCLKLLDKASVAGEWKTHKQRLQTSVSAVSPHLPPILWSSDMLLLQFHTLVYTYETHMSWKCECGALSIPMKYIWLNWPTMDYGIVSSWPTSFKMCQPERYSMQCIQRKSHHTDLWTDSSSCNTQQTCCSPPTGRIWGAVGRTPSKSPREPGRTSWRDG